MFMGCEIGQTWEWNHDEGLPWHLLQFPVHHKLQTMVRELNGLYRREPALYEVDDRFAGFEWIDFHDAEASVISFVRFAHDREDFMVFCATSRRCRARIPHRRAIGGRIAKFSIPMRRCSADRTWATWAR